MALSEERKLEILAALEETAKTYQGGFSGFFNKGSRLLAQLVALSFQMNHIPLLEKSIDKKLYDIAELLNREEWHKDKASAFKKTLSALDNQILNDLESLYCEKNQKAGSPDAGSIPPANGPKA